MSKPVLKLSSVSNSWFFGFILAIFTMMIFNIVSQHINTTYYSKFFCESLF